MENANANAFFAGQYNQIRMFDVEKNPHHHTPLPQAPEHLSSDKVTYELFWEDPFNFSDHTTEIDDNLTTRYVRIRLDREETIIFDTHDTHDRLAVQLDETEICRVLVTTFFCLGYQEGRDLRSSIEILEQIQVESNYSVVEIVHVMNNTQYRMHRVFTRTTFHGTSLKNSGLITVTGF